MSRAAAEFAVDKRFRVVAGLLEYNQGDDLLKSLILRKNFVRKIFFIGIFMRSPKTVEETWKKRARKVEKLRLLFSRTVSYSTTFGATKNDLLYVQTRHFSCVGYYNMRKEV